MAIPLPSSPELTLMAIGGALMSYILLHAIGRSAMANAAEQIVTRRTLEARRRAENAAAEAAGRAAALEPLALNPDGSIEEPIIAVVERH
jgi:hypothetical protein